MRTVAPLLCALLLGMALAGCTSKGGSPASQIPTDLQTVTVGKDTGAIRGIVYDASIVPIAGAQVTARLGGQNVTKTTSATGTFLFNNVPAGTVFLQASKLGYMAAQTSVDVKAGDANPPVTKMRLDLDVANRPYAFMTSWKGFIECSVGAQAPNNPYVGGGALNPCFVDDATSHNTNDVGLTSGLPTMVQVELVWKGTQALGNVMEVGIFNTTDLTGSSDFAWAGGQSPVILRVNGSAIHAAIGTPATITERVFPAGDSGNPVTTVLNQEFAVYTTQFFGFVPKADWSFAATQVECTTPAQCG